MAACCPQCPSAAGGRALGTGGQGPGCRQEQECVLPAPATSFSCCCGVCTPLGPRQAALSLKAPCERGRAVCPCPSCSCPLGEAGSDLSAPSPSSPRAPRVALSWQPGSTCRIHLQLKAQLPWRGKQLLLSSIPAAGRPGGQAAATLLLSGLQGAPQGSLQPGSSP